MSPVSNQLQDEPSQQQPQPRIMSILRYELWRSGDADVAFHQRWPTIQHRFQRPRRQLSSRQADTIATTASAHFLYPPQQRGPLF
jgi:hypothetical protein